jgi:hypothetical protein
MLVQRAMRFAWIGQIWLSTALAIGFAGLLALTDLSTEARAHDAQQPPMRFVVARGNGPLCDPICPEWISAEGAIEGGTAKKFKKFLKTIGDRKLPIVMQSPGGDVDAALAMARMIRERQLVIGVGRTVFSACEPEARGCKADKDGTYAGSATSSLAYCNSACPMVLAGGAQRLAGGYAYVGVHQVTSVVVKEKIYYRTKTRIVKGKKVVTKEVVSRKRTGSYKTTEMSKSLSKKLHGFFSEMGVSTDILEPIKATPAADLLWLNGQALADYKLVTSGMSIEDWVNPQVCAQSPRRDYCRKVSAPPTVRIVRSRRCDAACEEWIALEGDIDKTALPLMREAVRKLAGPRLIVLSSRGGDIESAMELGRFVREQGLSVSLGKTIASDCRPKLRACAEEADYEFLVGHMYPEPTMPVCGNVCVLALAGGVERFVAESTTVQLDSVASLGRRSAKKKTKVSETESLLSSYLDEMGINPGLVKMLPQSSNADGIALSARGMRMMKVSTGQLPRG